MLIDVTRPLSQSGFTHSPNINIDVFNTILEWLPRTDLLTMSYLSHSVREEVRTHLLLRPIKLSGNQQVASFSSYALAGGLNNLSCIHNLSMYYADEQIGHHHLQAFLQVLDYCVNLSALRLVFCDGLLWKDPRVSQAISSLRALTSLTVMLSRHTLQRLTFVYRMVAESEFSLLQLGLPWVPVGQPGADLLRNVAKVHARLHSLSLKTDSFSPPGIPFAAVRNLHIACEGLGALPSTYDLYDTFPNLRVLSIDALYSRHADDPEEEPPTASQPSTARNPERLWPFLETLRGTPTVINTLGLPCRVHGLEFTAYSPQLHDSIAEAVSRHRPRKLTLRVLNPQSLRMAPHHLLHGKDAGPDRVRYLVMKPVMRIGLSLKTHYIMEALRTLMSESRVEFLHVAIILSDVFIDRLEEVPGELVPPYRDYPGRPATEVAMRLLDVEAIVDDVAKHCGSVRTVAVTRALIGRDVWSIRREDGVVNMDWVEPFAAEELLKQEEQRYLAD